MLERCITAVHVEDPGDADAAAVRERLKAAFPPGAARRMTLLGMLAGAALQRLGPGPHATIVYSSAFGESRSLESYLRSFPGASPTLFQSSIHPSGVQQAFILRQQPVPVLLPFAGGPGLVAQSLLAALTSPDPRPVWCGGDEQGTWLRDLGVAAGRSFAFALALAPPGTAPPLGRVALAPADGSGELPLAAWCDLLRDRRDWDGAAGPGWRLRLEWT